MKIGILTHHYVKNFGAYMQAFALLSTIKKEYPIAQVEFIDFRVKKHEINEFKHFFGFKPKRGDTLIGYFNKIGLLFKHKKYEDGLPRSKRVYSAEEIDLLKYDLIIVGSDEVWNFKDVAFSPIKFGVGISTPMITYSASVGGSTVKDNIPDKIIDGIKKFRAIASRDEKTEELIAELTERKVIRTLDPVYLWNYDLHSSEKILKIASEKPYILIYDCHLKKEQVQSLVDFAIKNDMNIIGAGEYRKWYKTVDTTNITPFEWAYLFKNAWGVITGTFHGTSFSIKYNRKFVAYLTEENRINKVGSLLKDFGLTSQIVSIGSEENLLTKIQNSIDYERVNKLIQEKKEESLSYLFNEINKIPSK